MMQLMTAGVQLRKELNDRMGQMQHELQGVSRQDIDEVMRRMDHIEGEIGDAVTQMSERLEAIATYVIARENGTPRASDCHNGNGLDALSTPRTQKKQPSRTD
jgi:hypothetical protein